MTKKLFGKLITVLMVFMISVKAFSQKGYEPIRGMGVEANL